MLQEREKLRELDPFTVIDYIKASVEILMNMKTEEPKPKKSQKSKNLNESDLISVKSSSRLNT